MGVFVVPGLGQAARANPAATSAPADMWSYPHVPMTPMIHFGAASGPDGPVPAAAPGGGGSCSSTFPTPPGTTFTPAQLRTAYDWSSKYAGSGLTIAIIDAYSTGTELADINCFDSFYHLPSVSLTVVQPFGSAPKDTTGNWGLEIALDIEWAHVLAPSANILLIEAPNATAQVLIGQAVPYAATHGANIVSMSFGGLERDPMTGTLNCPLWQSLDLTIGKYWGSLKSNVAFVAASGDNGAFVSGRFGGVMTIYPSTSPEVTAVGGTTLALNSKNQIKSEVVWNNAYGASGGGQSLCFPVPIQQKADGYNPPPALFDGTAWIALTGRGVPDVSFVADPLTGVWVYTSASLYECPTKTSPWCWVGGTSLGSPAWAGILADLRSSPSIWDNPITIVESMYDLNITTPRPVHDILSGNNGYYATAGWDGATGAGTPDIYQYITQFDTFSRY